MHLDLEVVEVTKNYSDCVSNISKWRTVGMAKVARQAKTNMHFKLRLRDGEGSTVAKLDDLERSTAKRLEGSSNHKSLLKANGCKSIATVKDVAVFNMNTKSDVERIFNTI